MQDHTPPHLGFNLLSHAGDVTWCESGTVEPTSECVSLEGTCQMLFLIVKASVQFSPTAFMLVLCVVMLCAAAFSQMNWN